MRSRCTSQSFDHHKATFEKDGRNERDDEGRGDLISGAPSALNRKQKL